MSQQAYSSERYTSFSAFYPYYLSEHADPRCRTMHFIGTSLTFVVLAAAIFVHPLYLIGVPIAGYGFAWIGHFFLEKNKPATFKYPLWSLIGDYTMYFSWLSGRLPKQLAQAGVR
ncbi:MAG: DUF962 domain-containing protein [Pseudomonadota bacterium]